MVWARRLLIALGIVVLVAALGVAALALLINPNDYKSTLEEAVHKRYERTLVIDGDIRLSLFPRLGLEINRASLSEPRSTQVFAAVDRARVAVAWWPLLSRHLVVEHLSVSGVKANVVRDADGRFNFHDLLQSNAVPGSPGEPARAEAGDEHASIELNIAGVSLSGGEIAVRDEASASAIRIERLNLSASDIFLGRPFEFSAAGRILGQAPRADATVQAQGRMTLDPYADAYAVHGLDLRVVGVLPSVKANGFAVRGDAAYDGRARSLSIASLVVGFQGDVALATPLTGVDAQLAAPRLVADLDHGELQLEKLAVKATGRMDAQPFTFALDAPTLQITERTAVGGPVQGSFTLDGPRAVNARLSLSELSGNASRFDVARLDLSATIKQGERSTEVKATSPFGGSLRDQSFDLPAFQADVRIADPALGAPMEIPATGRFRADLADQTAAGALQARLDDGAFDASFDVAGFGRPVVHFNVAADRLDVDKLLPPVATPANASAPARPAAQGGNGESRPAEAPVDLSRLNALEARGAVRVGELIARGVHVRDLAAKLSVVDGRAELNDLAAGLYEGRVAGRAFADAQRSQLGVDLRFSDVAVQPLLVQLADYDGLSGRGDVHVDVAASGKTVAAMRRALSGRIDVLLRDGEVRGMNVAQTLRGFEAMLREGADRTEAADRERSTDYSELRGRLELQQGVGTVRDLAVSAPLLRVAEGSPATVNVADETLDLVLLARVVNTSTGQGGKELERLRDVTIPIRLTGTFAEPHYEVQWSRVGSQALGRALRDEAERQLERLLSREGETAREGSAGRALGEALKGLLKP